MEADVYIKRRIYANKLQREYHGSYEYFRMKDFLQSNLVDPEARSTSVSLMKILARILKNIPDNQAFVLIRRFGLSGDEPESFKEIAARVGWKSLGSVHLALSAAIDSVSVELLCLNLIKKPITKTDLLDMIVTERCIGNKKRKRTPRRRRK